MSRPPSQKKKVRTLDGALAFVQRVGICSIFSTGKSSLPALWDAVDLPEKRPGERGWGQRVSAVWRWKNELPATFPDEIFYGKTKGGIAVLMTLAHLRTKQYPEFHRPIEQCSPLAQQIFDLVRAEPLATTGWLRGEILCKFPTARAAFQKALTETQVTLNIVRSNAPDVTTDSWVRLTEQYPEFRRG